MHKLLIFMLDDEQLARTMAGFKVNFTNSIIWNQHSSTSMSNNMCSEKRERGFLTQYNGRNRRNHH